MSTKHHNAGQTDAGADRPANEPNGAFELVAGTVMDILTGNVMKVTETMRQENKDYRDGFKHASSQKQPR